MRKRMRKPHKPRKLHKPSSRYDGYDDDDDDDNNNDGYDLWCGMIVELLFVE